MKKTHICVGIGCGKRMEHRGFCSQKCHDIYYDNIPEIQGEFKMKPICICGHSKEKHYRGLGKCESMVNVLRGRCIVDDFCSCSRYAPERTKNEILKINQKIKESIK